ncbi:amino acid adenylation domain-containing protein [Maribacter sp. 2210JD10-5]|uniref:amino acid adenylation domain-containing protein n=1 Tax=Maribacter sp. 2210JD10-5 TaxID=3386272 RepID=UPI0039BD81A6
MMNPKSNFALTGSQMKIWSGQTFNKSSPLYNMVLTFEINGEIQVPIFEKAIQILINSNDIFRLHIVISNGIPEQRVFDTVKSPLEYIDFSDKGDSSKLYSTWVKDNKARLFKTEELLYHAALCKIDTYKFVFYFNQHHLITDGWSMKYIYDELNGIYKSLLDNKEENTNKTDAFEVYAKENSYRLEEIVTPFWKLRLDNINEVPSLYGVTEQPVSTAASRITFTLGKDRTRKLKALALEKELRAWTVELALSNIFLTVVATLISKIGDNDKFSIGVPYHNRFNPKDTRIAGLLMELFPVATEITDDESFISLHEKIKKESFEVIKNLVNAKPPIALLKSFNVLLNYIPVDFGDFAGMSTKVDWLLSGHIDPNHPMRIQIHDFNNEEDFTFLIDLNHEFFSEKQMTYVQQHFIKTIDAFINDKNKKIRKLNIISEHEVAQIKKWNVTKVPYDQNEILITKFYQQVEKTPDSPALVFNGKSMTYNKLNQKSNQVAHFLIDHGVKKNDLIAISADRSFSMMVFIYGIVKSGAAYLPIDRDTPVERVKFILKSASSKILFYNHKKLDVNNIEGINLFDMNDIRKQVSSRNNKNPSVNINPNDLAYVIYTSGSTGEPKGVKCHHSGICNRLNWMNSYYPITTEDVFLQKTPITFDVSVWELFWPLQQGAKLILEIPDGHKDPNKIVKTIIEEKVTVIHFVPSMLNIFIETREVQNCTSLEKIFCSGEALSSTTVAKTHKMLGGEIYNLYGPTEASIDVTSWHCKRDSDVKNIPIGYPVDNTQIYILGDDLNLLPIGVAGELHIGGVQVAKGYVEREGLTHEKFIKNMFSSNPKAKLYKTGDLARYRPDGAIEYIGRMDNQVKLRGLRIELGEIEKSIEKLSNVTQAVVVMQQQNNGHDYLVAYYTGEAINEEKISNGLRRSLPEYMIPSFYVYLDKFPLSSSGKIDRKRMPLYDISEISFDGITTPPTNEIEEIVFSVWKEVLQTDAIGIHTNFIQIGGNSLNAMVITSRLREAFELDLSIANIFTYPTIMEYAKYVEDTITKLLDEK